jgi:hypothetical protein
MFHRYKIDSASASFTWQRTMSPWRVRTRRDNPNAQHGALQSTMTM